MREERGALGDPGDAPRVAGGEDADRQGEGEGERRARARQDHGAGDGVEPAVPDGGQGRALAHPADQAHRGHAQRGARDHGEEPGADPAGPAQPVHADPADRATGADAVVGPAGAGLAPEHQHRQQHEHGGQGEGELPVEAHLERREDRPGEGVQAQDGHGAEVGEHVEGHQQGAAGDRRAHLGERDGEQRGGGAAAERAGHVLLAGVDAGERGRHRQVYVRVRVEGHHRHRGPEPLEAPRLHAGQQVRDGHPRERRHVGGHGQRQRQQDGQQAAAGRVGAGDEPGGAHADHQAQRGHHGGERERGGGQGAHARAHDGVQPGAEPALGGAQEQVADGDERDRRGHEGRGGQRRGSAPSARAADGRLRCSGGQSRPASWIIWMVVWRSSRSLRSTSGALTSESSGKPAGCSTPSTSGYSPVSSAKYD